MFPVDALPAVWMEEREAEIKAERARKAELARAAQCLARSGIQSAPTTPLATPHTGFGFISGFFSSITRNSDNTPCLMSRTSSSPGNNANNGNTSNPCVPQTNNSNKASAGNDNKNTK